VGWTFTHREKGISNKEWFQENVVGNSNEVLDMATVGGAFKGIAYSACRVKETGEVFAVVFLTQWVPNDYYNFGYKDIEESMGPAEDNCPKRIFDLLEPLPEDRADPTVEGNWAAQWRERVAANLAKKAAEPKITKGTKIRFPSWRWNGGDYGVCEYVGGRRGTNLFKTERGFLVRFRNWRSGPYEVVA